MKYAKRLGIILSAFLFLGSIGVISGSAQTRIIVTRPIAVRPHWGWGYDPFWRINSWRYDPFYDPYYWAQREKYHYEQSVKDAQKKLNKDRVKYREDGFIDAKEQEKLDKDVRKYNEAVEKLRQYRNG